MALDVVELLPLLKYWHLVLLACCIRQKYLTQILQKVGLNSSALGRVIEIAGGMGAKPVRYRS